MTTGTMARNGYYVVPLFSSNYAGVQNNYGVSGDLMIRQQAFELLAEYGYYDGMIPYISNQYKESAKAEQTILSDRYVLEKIFDGAYETMADFKKAMFQRRIEKTNELKPVTIMWKNQSVTINNFEKLRLLMKEAIENDLMKVNVLPGGTNNIRAQATEVERLKQEIFKSYITQTKDFSDSIYGVNPAPIDPPDPEQPGETDPEQPGETDPEKPGETDPEKPGGTDPEKPGETEPEKPGGTEPEKPGETNPGEPGETDPEKPGEANPGQPGETNPEKPGETDPGKPGGTESADPDMPEETISEQPGGNSGKEVPLRLLLCRVSSAKTSHTIRWNPVKSADGYEIYGAKSNGKYKRLKTVSKKSDKWKHKKLNRGTQYKYYVNAYKKIGGKRVILAKSLPVFGTTKGGKYTNPSKIEVKKTRMSVNPGKKVRIHIKVTGKKISKAGKKVRYVSSDPSVAKVSKKGSITGKKRGSCIIYCIAQNGLYKKVKVKVNP